MDFGGFRFQNPGKLDVNYSMGLDPSLQPYRQPRMVLKKDEDGTVIGMCYDQTIDRSRVLRPGRMYTGAVDGPVNPGAMSTLGAAGVYSKTVSATSETSTPTVN